MRLANRDKRFVWTLDEVRGHARDWPGVLVRLCLPSNLDWVLALIFAGCMAPNRYP